jgi:membrane-associated protein
MFNQFTQLVADASGWAYAVAFVFAFLDALLPVVPSETAVITAGVVAATGHLSLPLVIVAAACGAFAGDNAAYFIGHRFGPYAKARFFRGEKGRKTIRWTERQLAERGGELILIARFIPGGRIAVTLSAGAARYPWPRFAIFDAFAAIIWASYAALLGFFGGKAFEHTPWAGLLLALAIAFAVTGALELGRAYRRRRRQPQQPDGARNEQPSQRADNDHDAANLGTGQASSDRPYQSLLFVTPGNAKK